MRYRLHLDRLFPADRLGGGAGVRHCVYAVVCGGLWGLVASVFGQALTPSMLAGACLIGLVVASVFWPDDGQNGSPPPAPDRAVTSEVWMSLLPLDIDLCFYCQAPLTVMFVTRQGRAYIVCCGRGHEYEADADTLEVLPWMVLER